MSDQLYLEPLWLLFGANPRTEQKRNVVAYFIQSVPELHS